MTITKKNGCKNFSTNQNKVETWKERNFSSPTPLTTRSKESNLSLSKESNLHSAKLLINQQQDCKKHIISKGSSSEISNSETGSTPPNHEKSKDRIIK